MIQTHPEIKTGPRCSQPSSSPAGASCRICRSIPRSHICPAQMALPVTLGCPSMDHPRPCLSWIQSQLRIIIPNQDGKNNEATSQFWYIHLCHSISQVDVPTMYLIISDVLEESTGSAKFHPANNNLPATQPAALPHSLGLPQGRATTGPSTRGLRRIHS